ncbi:uncharacterized protein si:busm1-163l24.3 [Solea solea]|uniref:uncharacterized protein si:busm1-163l24.3 n=1 Tax=Solea solea TaxID=90069 RepID=UPI00272B2F1D|nr:uncharacterized protein si:busm1-163l24.3 [Solea solea]XP_058508675.1 uncharacterized protein si:busm1-163l24.3 [Solea solea]
MAERGRTVRVSGLPTDIEDDRLRDKLQIHFLRAKNGGGEVDSVAIVKTISVSALIAFEEREVAQRVVQQSRHILEVDGKKHTLTVTEQHESPGPDKVVLSLAATVKCSQVPGGLLALTSLHESHPDVQINSENEDICTLCGTYTEVQAALAHLLGPLSADKGSCQPDPTGSRSFQMAKKSHTQGSGNHSRKPHKQREQSLSYEYNTSTQSDLAHCDDGSQDIGQAEGADLQHLGRPATSEEDFLLILDADMFQYLQKNCSQEYQLILSQYGVEVVDLTSQGLTTLFLQITNAGRKSGNEQQRLEMAHKAISRLYQENESKIRHDQLPKSLLPSSSAGLQKVVQSLKVQLPKLLLNEDDKYIYIIGSSSDVSEAKQTLLLKHDRVSPKKDDVASLLRYSTYDSSPAEDVRVSSIEGCLDNDRDPLPRSGEDQRSVEGARKCKLAARFKDSGLTTLGNQPAEFTLRGRLSSGRLTHTGPILGHHVLSEAAGISGERFSREEPQNTGGDILFRRADTENSVMQNITSLQSNVIDVWPKIPTSPDSTTPSSLSGRNTLPAAESAPTVKRASSFSGTLQQKAELSQRSHDDSSKSTVRTRGRSSSFNTQTGKENPDVYSAEIKVSKVMWQHIRKAYSARVDSLTTDSDVQIKENHPHGSRDVTITLSGTDVFKVNSCQLGLQKQVDLVSIDFSVHELRLSDLGITDPADETLQSCCTEVRSRFKKVTLLFLKDTLYLLGPIHLCSKVAATLREVFPGDSAQTPQHRDSHSPSTSNRNPSTSLQMSEDQSAISHRNSKSQAMPESQVDKAEGAGGKEKGETKQKRDFGETEIVNGPVNQPLVRKDPVIKEKVKNLGSMQMDGQKTETLVNLSTAGSDRNLRRVNGVGSATAHETTQKDSMQERRGEIHNHPPMETRSGQRDTGFICVCGDNGASVRRTKCGATMCTKCLAAVHVHCRVCHEKEPMPQGIQGNMSHAKLHISLPGHSKDTVIKITYCIPDGVQGRDHPSPGNPFQGGVFEAFLPDCEKARKLLHRMEKAFRLGLTFKVAGKDAAARVTWDCIPHKTSLHGGKAGSGYPDSNYLTRLSQALTTLGIEE